MLLKIYPEPEVCSLCRIILEDAFDSKTPSKTVFLTYPQLASLEKIYRRMSASEPVQYVLEQADFMGLKFVVNKHVLIPRQETEELVELAIDYIKSLDNQSVIKIIDIGTGSGCIPIGIAKKFPNAEFTALDVSGAAIKVAKKNAKKYGLNIEFIQADILDKSVWENLDNYDLIISNPPYIPYKEKSKVPLSVWKYEPEIALWVDDKDPLVFYRKIIAFAKLHLKKNGACLVETNEFNAQEVLELFKAAGFDRSEIKKDILEKDRMIRAQVG